MSSLPISDLFRVPETQFSSAQLQRYASLPVQDAISAILRDEALAKARLRHSHKVPPRLPVVPRRKPLPPSAPSTTPLTRVELADRITPRPTSLTLAQCIAERPTVHPAPLPITHSIQIDFDKKTPDEIRVICEEKIFATTTRLVPIWDNDEIFASIPHEQEEVLNKLSRAINWASDHAHEAYTWTKAQRDSLNWGLKSIGDISFKSFRQNHKYIFAQLGRVYEGRYFDWIEEKYQYEE